MMEFKDEMNLEISRLRPEDADRAHANFECFWDMGNPTSALTSFLADPNCILLVAEVEGRPIGQVLGYVLKRWDSKKPMLLLYSIDVAKAHRRKGVGSKLIREFRRIGEEIGCGTSFVLTTASNAAAMALYESAGGTRPNPDDVMFEWE